MAEAKKSTPPVTLRLKRTFAVPRERVFAAFAHQEQMDRWMCRDAADHIIKYLKFDFRVGGGFEMEIRTPKHDIYLMHITYREITPPSKIVFTWGHEHVGAFGKRLGDTLQGTLVTFEFQERGKSTEVILTHELLPSQEEYESHKQGWTGCLEKLGALIENGKV
ncbi:MAG TPA: SRPBCC domain-containing protein [Candidatus Acidoferrales bacterium]